MDLSLLFSQPPYQFFSGTTAAASAVTPGPEVAGIGGHWYLLDLESGRYRMASIPALRPQQDTSERPGEQSLSIEGLWRRTVSTFDHGAGQTWYDRDGGDPRRFRSSRSVDPWTEWEMGLLNTTEEITTNAGGWFSLAAGEFSGTKLLVATGPGGKCVTITSSGTVGTVAGLAGNVYAASTGTDVYVADTAGIHKINAAGTGITAFNTNITAATGLFFAKGRIFAVKGAAIYNVIDGTTTTPIYTNPWGSWLWTAVAEGQEAVYACGFSGDRSQVFAIPISSDGTGLDAPRVALSLPDGELAYSLASYVGFVVVGTSLGVRLTQPQTASALVTGPLVGEGGPVRCLEPQDRFVWFGWDDMFSDVAGLGRVDLTRFVETMAPAYATDLIGGQGGRVNAAATFTNKRWFTCGTSVYRESSAKQPSGFFETGRVTFNVSDEKTPVFLDLRHALLGVGDRIEVEARTDENLDYLPVGFSATLGSDRPVRGFSLDHDRAVSHEAKVILKATAGDGPKLTAVTLGAQVAPDRTHNVFLPLVISDMVTFQGGEYTMDVSAEVEYIRELVDTQRLVRFSQGSLVISAFVEDYEWIPHHATALGDGMNGTMVVKLKSAEIHR